MTTKSVKSQRERFEESARELGIDLDEEKLKAALREITKSRTERKADVNVEDDK